MLRKCESFGFGENEVEENVFKAVLCIMYVFYRKC